MIRNTLKTALILAVATYVYATAWKSAKGQTPDRRGEVALTAPEYQGVKANAPIPPELHLRNEGGSDGAGMCVPTSVDVNGRYQGVPGLEGGKDSTFWRTAKSWPGGYGPEKLARLVEETLPGEKYASYVGTDTRVLDQLSAAGYPIGATMNTGALYHYAPIHHMVSLAHYKRGQWACVVDNNDPGKYHWMPATEFDRRWIDGGTGWAWVWTRKPSVPRSNTPAAAVVAAGLFGFMLILFCKSR